MPGLSTSKPVGVAEFCNINLSPKGRKEQGWATPNSSPSFRLLEGIKSLNTDGSHRKERSITSQTN